MSSQSSERHSVQSPSALGGVALHAHWLPRIALASTFLFYGIDKFMGAGVAGFSEMMGMPILVAYLVAIAEVLGGVGILAGAVIGATITRLAALAMVPVLLGAIFMVHWGQWHFMSTDSHPMGGMSYQVGLLLVALYFLVRGNDV